MDKFYENIEVNTVVDGAAEQTPATPNVPQESLEQFARLVFPLLQTYYESEEGKAAFARWKKEKLQEDDREPTNRTKVGLV